MSLVNGIYLFLINDVIIITTGKCLSPPGGEGKEKKGKRDLSKYTYNTAVRGRVSSSW